MHNKSQQRAQQPKMVPQKSIERQSSPSNAGKVFGQDEEIQVLFEACKRATSGHQSQEIVLIQGHSGTGKTSLTNTLIPTIQKETGFFLTGKFELSQHQAPFTIFA